MPAVAVAIDAGTVRYRAVRAPFRRPAILARPMPVASDPTTWAPPAPTIVRLRSGNDKTGPAAVTARPQTTCPRSCPLYGAGCYAENRGQMGRPSPFQQADAAAASGRLRPLSDLWTARYRNDPPRAVRFNVSGDYLAPSPWPILTDAGAILPAGIPVPDYAYIDATNRAADARDWTAWGYTHAWRALSPDLFTYRVRASVQSAAEAAEAAAAGWHTAIVDPGPSSPDTVIRATIAGPDGPTVAVQCPATLPGATITCNDCRACGTSPRAIVFPTHGSRRRRAAAAVTAYRMGA